MVLDRADYAEHWIAEFIDAPPTWRSAHDGCADSSIPLSDDYSYALVLGSDGAAELAIRQTNGYTYALVMHIGVRGRWELHTLWADSFSIAIRDPLITVIQAGAHLAAWQQAIVAEQPWCCYRDGAGFQGVRGLYV